MTYQQFLKEQINRIKNTSLEEEAIKLLILELSGLDGAHFLMNINEEINDDLKSKMEKAIDMYVIEGKPVQHILGYFF